MLKFLLLCAYTLRSGGARRGHAQGVGASRTDVAAVIQGPFTAAGRACYDLSIISHAVVELVYKTSRPLCRFL